MINGKDYDYLKEHYGDVASWTIWDPPGSTATSNVGSLKPFENPEITQELNTEYVFVGLNGSGVHEGFLETGKPWFNFHSSLPNGKDYKMRYALMNTPFWGSYITDIIKHLPEVDSNKVMAFLRAHPDVVEENVGIFKDEIAHLNKDVTIIALGNHTYDILSRYFSGTHVVKKIKHYSYTISKEDYRKELFEIMGLTYDESLQKTAEGNASETNIKMVQQARITSTFHITEAGMPDFVRILEGSSYRLQANTTDHSREITDLFYGDEKGRKLGFYKRRDGNLMVFSTGNVYPDLCRYIKMPETNPKKSQPHFIVSYEEFAKILGLIVEHNL